MILPPWVVAHTPVYSPALKFGAHKVDDATASGLWQIAPLTCFVPHDQSPEAQRSRPMLAGQSERFQVGPSVLHTADAVLESFLQGWDRLSPHACPHTTPNCELQPNRNPNRNPNPNSTLLSTLPNPNPNRSPNSKPNPTAPVRPTQAPTTPPSLHRPPVLRLPPPRLGSSGATRWRRCSA